MYQNCTKYNQKMIKNANRRDFQTSNLVFPKIETPEML